MQNPIGEADLEWILHRNCEGTEQLRMVKEIVSRRQALLDIIEKKVIIMVR